MLAVFKNDDEVLVCEVDSEREPITRGYFTNDCRDKTDYDLSFVDGPIMITNSMRIEPELELDLSQPGGILAGETIDHSG